MKLKQILFGSLLLAVPFTACTNEELLEIEAPANLEEAVALGEGYTIVGTKGVDSRFVISEANGKFSAVWEATDMVGGAWIGYQKATQKGTNNYVKHAQIMSNHPFSISKDLGGMKTVEFTAPTNVFEGKHILYYPYDPSFKAAVDYIPVKIEQNQTMDCTAGKELDHINANSFAWTTIDAKGGPVAGKFTLNQVTNIVSLKLGAEKKISDRFVGKKIEKIIIEAVSEDGDAMLYNEAQLKGNSPADGKYASFEGEMNYVNPINTYILSVENATADYQATESGEDGVTAKPFYLAMLKANDDIEAITVRAIMSDGRVFYKTIEIDDDEDLFEELIQAEGTDQLVEMEVVFDSEDKAGTIYTADQFEDALSSVKNNGVITLGADITLDALTLDYDYNFTIEGSKLIIKNEMEVTAGHVTFEDGVLVAKGADIYVGEDGVLKASEVVEIGSIDVDGEAILSGNTIKSATVNKAGKLTIDNAGYVDGSSNQIYAGVAALKIGRSSNVELTHVKLTGKTTITDGEVDFSDVKNTGVLTATGYLTGTVHNVGGTLNMEEVDGTLTVTNNGKVVVTGEDWEFEGTINNDAATGNPTYYSAGTMEVSMDEENVFTFNSITMAAGTTLDLKVGAMKENVANALVLNAATSTLNIAEESVFVLAGENTSANGLINIENDDNIEETTSSYSFTGGVKIAATVKKASKLGDVLELNDNNTIVIADALTIPATTTPEYTKMVGLNWVVKKNITLQDNVTLGAEFETVGSVTIGNSKTDGTVYTFTLNQTEENVINGGTLTVANYVTLDGTAANTQISLKNNGSIAKGTYGNISGNVTVAL